MATFEIKDGKAIIPQWETEIGVGDFENCEDLRSVVIPSSVTKIKCQAFRRCRNLTSIEIPASVTEIWSGAFQDCPRLSHITISPDNKNYYSPDGCNVIIEKE